MNNISTEPTHVWSVEENGKNEQGNVIFTLTCECGQIKEVRK